MYYNKNWHFLGKLLITTGSPENEGRYSEVIDVLNEKVTCQDLPQTPHNTIHAVGGLIDGTPVVCGGYPWRKKCFTITKTSADFMSTQKRYNGYAGSGIVFNDQGQQKVSPIFKIVGSYI